MRRIQIVSTFALLVAACGMAPGGPGTGSVEQSSISGSVVAELPQARALDNPVAEAPRCADSAPLSATTRVRVTETSQYGAAVLLATGDVYCVGLADEIGQVLPMLASGPILPPGNGDAAGGDPMPAKGGGGDPGVKAEVVSLDRSSK